MKPLIFCPILILALLAGTAIAQSPEPDEEPIDAHLPLIPQEQSPIQFDVKFWPTHILAGEWVNMELTLRNVGTEPFRIPKAVPDVYGLRVNLYLDHPEFGPGHQEINVFYSVPPRLVERAWERITHLHTVMPGETYVIRSNHIFGAAGSTGGVARAADSVIAELETARIRTVIYLDDGNFVPADWVEFTIEQPAPREQDWLGDIVFTLAGDVPTRYGLLKQRVADRNFWFIASERDRRLTDLRRLPMKEIRQVVAANMEPESLRELAVLGTDAAGGWHYYGPLPREEGQRRYRSGFQELGPGKTWRMQLTNETDVEIIEVPE